MKRSELQTEFMKLRHHGATIVEKKMLLWFLGRTNDGAGAWDTLLEEWEEFGCDRKELFGMDHNGYITLTATPVAQISEEWAA